MRFSIITFAILIAWSSASAQPTGTMRCVWTDDTHTIARLIQDDTGSQFPAASYAYDNWSTPEFDGGLTVRVGLQRVSTHEVGDDLQLTSAGELSAMRRSVANLDTERTIIQTTETVRWYDSESSELLGSYTYTLLWGSAGAPGTSRYVLQGDGFWSFLHINLPENIFYSEQNTDIVGAGQDAIGRITAGPNTLGSSTRFIRDFTTGQDIDLGSDQVNLLLAVRTNPIPTPGANTVVFAAISLALRRRRR